MIAQDTITTEDIAVIWMLCQKDSVSATTEERMAILATAAKLKKRVENPLCHVPVKVFNGLNNDGRRHLLLILTAMLVGAVDKSEPK